VHRFWTHCGKGVATDEDIPCDRSQLEKCVDQNIGRQSIAWLKLSKTVGHIGRRRRGGIGITYCATVSPSDPPLCAEDRETDAKCKCLPMAAELLATGRSRRRTELRKEAIHESEQRLERSKGILTSNHAPPCVLEHMAPAWVLGRLHLARRP
jgi:hypothetical protein